MIPHEEAAIAANRRERQRLARATTRPIVPAIEQMNIFRPMIAVGVAAVIALAFFWLLPVPAGAAERPVAEQVELTTVKASVGFYAVATADGRIAMVLPVSTRTPALQVGAATFYPATMELRQGKAAYRVKWIRKAATK